MTCRFALAIFLLLYVITSLAFAKDSQDGSQPSEVPTSRKTEVKASAQSGKKAPTSLTAEELKGQKDLEALRTRPEEYRVLVLGVQIFLGRFGYGTGPYTGKMDDKTQDALRAYQRHAGLQETGDINYHTLTRLTNDNKALDQPLPFLPPAAFHLDQWDTAVQVQGTWARKSGPTDDAIHTSRIYCFREQRNCIESTALLLSGNVPILDVLTHVYAIKEWDEEKLLSKPYDGEPCTTSIIRINREGKSVTRFTAYKEGKGVCAKVKTEDVQYQLVPGPQVYLKLKQRKAEATKRILRVAE